MKPRKVIQALIIIAVFCTSLLVWGSSSIRCAKEAGSGRELLDEGQPQAKEGRMIWEGLSGQFHSAF